MKTIGCIVLACMTAVCSAATRSERISQAPLLHVSEVTAANVAIAVGDDESTRYVTFRLRRDGASAVRLQLTDVRLAPGDKLYVYSADGAKTYGPIEGSGPSNTGNFSSEAILGSDVVVEWERVNESGGDLPFTVEALDAAELGGEPVSESQPAPVEQTIREVQTSLYRGSAVTHEIVDGMAMLEGDIVLGRADEMIPTTERSARKAGIRSSIGITATRYRWPNGVMPYVIDPAISDPGRVSLAISHWNTKLLGTVKMVPRTAESNYVTFRRVTGTSDCTSYVGMVGYNQSITVSDSCSVGTLIHEIGHAWGLWHEHTREDRDKYVTVNWPNIRTGQSHNFTSNVTNGDDLGTYDYGSIMHYGPYSYSVNGLPTITTIPPGMSIGQRSGLSAGDIAGVKKLYPPAQSQSQALQVPTVPVTISADPVGAYVTVDNVRYTTPASFSWEVGSNHTISAPWHDVGTTRYGYKSWSNGGSQTQVFSAPSAATTLSATFSVWYKLSVEQTGLGTVSRTGPSDGFYPRLSIVGLVAKPAEGYCFAGWSGLLPLTSATTSLSMSSPYTLTPTFLPGTVTLSSTGITVPAAGTTTSLNVSAPMACYWTPAVEPSSSWVRLSSTKTVAGAGSLTLTVAPNTTGMERATRISIGGNTVVLTQAAI